MDIANRFARAAGCRAHAAFLCSGLAVLALLAAPAAAQESAARDLQRQALAAAREGNLEQARDLALRGLAISPQDADGLNLLGEIHEQLGDLEPAQEAYRAAMSADPEWVAPVRNLGRLYLRRGQYRAAVLPLERAAELTPDDPLLFAWLGSAHNAAGRSAEARTAFERAFELDPESAELAVDVANARLADGDLRGAIEAAERGVAIDSTSLVSLVTLGDILMESTLVDDLVRAPAAFRRAVAARPQDPRLLLRLAWVYGELGLTAEQADTLREAIASGADDADTWLALGDALDGQRLNSGAVGASGASDGESRYSEAVEAFTRAIERDPGNGMAHYLRGQAYFNLNRRDEGLADVQRAIDTMPGDPGPLFTMARFLLLRSQLEEAEAFIQRASAADPGSTTAALLLGRLRLLQGRVDEAIPLLERAATAPGHSDATYLLGQALLKRGDVERGRRFMSAYQQSLNERRDSQVESFRLGVLGRGEVHKIRGRIFLEEGRHERAEAQLLAAVELVPDDGQAWELLGQVYELLGREVEADAARARALELRNPRPESAAERVQEGSLPLDQ